VQVLGNLLNNAAKYTNSGGRIVLSAHRIDSHVELRVRDNGIGIDPESQAKLFHLFSRLTSSADRTPAGLGIGLALVRQLVEMHGGEVAVSSAGVGLGSEFVVRLPLYDAGADAQHQRGDARSNNPSRRRILIADDNHDALESLALLLECDGHEVRRAVNGAQAFELASSWKPELALLDLGMPVMDGYEAVRRIREQPWGKDLLIVALSGWGQSSDIQRSREAGFDSHLVKPASFESLADVLGRLTAPEPARSAM
jgi:CheY-like chemotaxis protein